MNDELVMQAMRLAERLHRQANHYRKAPSGEDRPAYFLHLCEVAWMLQSAGAAPETVAAGFLHDVIEDCGYSRQWLAEEIGNTRVADLVQWVSEPDKGQSWESRNLVYLKRMSTAPREVLMLSCADKCSNLGDMLRLLQRGYEPDAFLSVGMEQQLAKFEALAKVFQGQVADRLYQQFRRLLDQLHG